MHDRAFIPFAEYAFGLPTTGAEQALFAFFALLGLLVILFMLPDRKPGMLVASLFHVTGGLLTLAANDLIGMLLGFELMTFSAFAIIIQRRDRAALGSGLRYIVVQIISAGLFFAGAVWHWHLTGSLAVAPAAPAAQPLFLASILIKTAMVPLHFWLVDAYPQAPYSGGVLLSVFTTKAGVYAAARLLRVGWLGQPVVAWIGAVVAVVAVVGALRQRDVRRLLAYHIVSQVGYMMAGVGLAGVDRAGDIGLNAGLFHAVNHIVYKALLLMVAAAICPLFRHDDLYRMGGALRRMPKTFVIAVIASAAIVGVPPMSGYASKELLKQATDNQLMIGLLSLASVGTGLSFIKFVYLIFVRPSKEPLPPLRDPGLLRLTPMLILAALCLFNGLWPALVSSDFAAAYYTPKAVAIGLLPPLVAAGIWVVGRRQVLDKMPAAKAIRWPEWVEKKMGSSYARLRAWHGIHPQTVFLALFVFWIALALGLS